MDSIGERAKALEQLLFEKRKVSTSLCEKATAEVRAEINALEAELDQLKIERVKLNTRAFERIIEQVAEMTRISMRLKLFHQYDDKFQLSHHVSWIQLRDPNGESEFDSMWWHYQDDEGQPNEEQVAKALKESRAFLKGFEQ